MKTCSYCGKENEDSATGCVECGTEGFKSDTAVAAAPPHAGASPPDLRLRDILADQAKLFRALVIVANGPYILTVLAPYVEPRFLSYETIDLLNRDGEAALFTLPSGIYWLTTLLYLAIAVGLYQFSASARAAFAIFSLAFGVLVLFGGVGITSPVVGFLALVTAMADGAILLLAYATPLKERFA
jgi:hypothetical protein